MCYTNKHRSHEEEDTRGLRMEDARRDLKRDIRPVRHEERDKKRNR